MTTCIYSEHGQPADESALDPTDERISAMVQAVSRVADVHVVDGRGRIANYTPDPAEYDGSTEPGSAWDEACDRLLAEVRAVLPRGWQAEWSDDDILIENCGPARGLGAVGGRREDKDERSNRVKARCHYCGGDHAAHECHETDDAERANGPRR